MDHQIKDNVTHQNKENQIPLSDYFFKIYIQNNCKKKPNINYSTASLLSTCIKFLSCFFVIFKNISYTYLFGGLFLGGLHEDFLGQGQVYLRLLAAVQTLPWILGYLDNCFVPSPCRELGLFTIIWIHRSEIEILNQRNSRINTCTCY